MKISVNWLKEFLDITQEPRELKSDLTMIGLNTESAIQVGDDWVLDVEVTTNRPDCLSHCGVARELATHYRRPLKKVELLMKESGGPTDGVASVEIADVDLCARYCARVVQNVQVAPSPDWLIKRLEAVGQRSINNVADVTNYVLMEMGHPLHAFDLSRLKQQKIVVRRAAPGEALRTLDGVDRLLDRENLVIADATHAVALAGIMGGEESGIAPSTRAVLLESAWFEPVSIRRTSKAQGLHTEASHRFERGADIEMAPLALDRAAALIQKTAGGEILRGIIDAYPHPKHALEVSVGRAEIARILGTEIPGEEVERILRGLGFQFVGGDGESWRVSVPSFRVDVFNGIDLVEEVARHVGYDRLPSRLRPALPGVERDTARDKIMTVSSLLVSAGYHEMVAPSIVDPSENERFSDLQPVLLSNPLSNDASAMRSSAVPSMLRAIRWNLDRGTDDAMLFELGKTYSLNREGVPEERQVLTLGSTGHRRPASVHDTEAMLDFFDLKGAVETVFVSFAAPGLVFEPAMRGYFHEGQCGRMRVDEVELAVFGRVAPDIVSDYKLRQEVWVAEINFERLLQFPLPSPKFQPISKFPAVERDFSLVLPDDLPYARLSAALAGMSVEEIRSFRPVDSFRGGGIPPGHYSLLLRVTFQSNTHTLTSEAVGGFSQQLVALLEGLGARLRG
jgi:phenylalanyl-tRNA synthetase beta chain